jgi:hypothetical protein
MASSPPKSPDNLDKDSGECVCVCVCVCALEIIIQTEFHIDSCECVPVSPLPMSHEFWLFVFVRVFEIFLHRCNTTLPTLMWIQTRKEKELCFIRFFFLLGGFSIFCCLKTRITNVRVLPSWYQMCFFISFSLSLSFKFPAHTQIYMNLKSICFTHTHTHTPTRV